MTSVVVSSWAHRASDIVFDDPDDERREYDPVSGLLPAASRRWTLSEQLTGTAA